MIKHLCFLFLFGLNGAIMSKPIENAIFDPYIHTVLVLRNNIQPELPYSLVGESFTLHWDDLSEDIREFRIYIRHCTLEWEYSELAEMDYLIGFNGIYHYNHDVSFNTKQFYRHYQLDFPNAELQIEGSGKFIIEIRDASNQKILAQKRIIKIEQEANITGGLRYCTTEQMEEGQEISWQVELGNKQASFSPTECHLEIIQNTDFNNIRIAKQFSITGQFTWQYGSLQVPCWAAGREYLFVDLNRMRQKEQRVREFLETDTAYVAIISTDINKQKEPYIFTIDADGNRVVRNPLETDWHTASEYADVYFSVEDNSPEALFLDLPWASKSLEMQADPTQPGLKFAHIYVKQGFFNYRYFRKKGNWKALWDGNVQTAQNAYTAFLVHNPMNAFRYRLVGYGIFSSR